MPRQKGNAAIAWRDPAGIEAAQPEQRLLAALIRLTIHDARSGDADAADWLIHDAPDWLTWIVTDDCDLGGIHKKIMRLSGVERPTEHAN